MMAEMDILRTIIVSAYQAARQRGEGENVAFDRAFSIYRERNPDRLLAEARAEVSRMIFEPAGGREGRGSVAVLDRAERDRPAPNFSAELAALRRRVEDVEKAQGDRLPPLEAKMQQVDSRLGAVERRQDKIDVAVTQFERLGQETRGQLSDISAQIAALANRYPPPPPPPPGEPHREEPEKQSSEREAPEREWDHRDGAREDEPAWLRNPLLLAWPWVWWFRLLRW